MWSWVAALTSLIASLIASYLAPRSPRVSIALSTLGTSIALIASLAMGSLQPCLAMALASSSFSLLGSLAAIRRMMFLAAATPHTSVFSVALAVALLGMSSLSYVAMFLSSLSLAFMALYLSKRFGSDLSTGLVVSLAATGTTLTLYYLSMVGVSISSLVVGEAPSSLSVSIPIVAAFLAIAVYAPLSLSKHLLISMDSDLAKLAGVKVLIHDLALASLFAGVGIATVTSVGFVVQHVLILIPPAIASASSRGCKEGIVLSTAISIASSCSGALLASLLKLSPAGLVGATLIASYLATEVGARVARVG